jgi:hypothetical protein
VPGTASSCRLRHRAERQRDGGGQLRVERRPGRSHPRRTTARRRWHRPRRACRADLRVRGWQTPKLRTLEAPLPSQSVTRLPGCCAASLRQNAECVRCRLVPTARPAACRLSSSALTCLLERASGSHPSEPPPARRRRSEFDELASLLDSIALTLTREGVVRPVADLAGVEPVEVRQPEAWFWAPAPTEQRGLRIAEVYIAYSVGSQAISARSHQRCADWRRPRPCPSPPAWPGHRRCAHRAERHAAVIAGLLIRVVIGAAEGGWTGYGCVHGLVRRVRRKYHPTTSYRVACRSLHHTSTSRLVV